MKFERSTDYELIRQIITHPRIYPHATDDYSPLAAEFRAIEHESIWYVLVRDDDECVLGLFMFVPENRVCWKIHTCLLPQAWGRNARQIAHQLGEWLWTNSECLRVITDVPEYNVHALKFALDAGMEKFGLNPKSYMKNGKLMDVILLGVSKPCLQR